MAEIFREPKNLQDAIQILRNARQSVVFETKFAWEKNNNALNYLTKQLDESEASIRAYFAEGA